MCKRREGVDLDFEKIEKNPGLRTVAKLCLNSFWGKGCVWHGHTCRKDIGRKVPCSNKTMEEAYQATLNRKSELEALGYQVVEKWECQLKRELNHNPEMARFFNDVEMVEPLNLNETLRGGKIIFIQ